MMCVASDKGMVELTCLSGESMPLSREHHIVFLEAIVDYRVKPQALLKIAAHMMVSL